MTKVVNNLYGIDEDYVFAISRYLESISESSVNKIQSNENKKLDWENLKINSSKQSENYRKGFIVFKKNCSDCHKPSGKPSINGFLNVINQPEPNNIIHLILEGIESPPFGSSDKKMPSKSNQINNKELHDLLIFLRENFSNQEQWFDLEEKISKYRIN